MDCVELKLTCDTSELNAEILSSIDIFNSVPELFNACFDSIDAFLEFVCANIDITTTSSAGDLRIGFKMSDSFRELMATLGARKRD